MKSNWWYAAVAGMALAAAAPAELAAQGRGNSNGNRAQQEARAAERDRQRVERDARNGSVRSDDGRRDARSDADVRRSDPRAAERERLRAERERQLERQRQLERERVLAERRRQDELERRRRAEYDRRVDRRVDDRRWDRDPWGYHTRASNRNAPAFCRSGAGHPVHGRAWCRDKGYGLGYDRWDRDGWGDIVFGRTRQSQLGRSTLLDLLGAATFRRFESYGHNYGRGSLTGHWVDDWGTDVLELYIGSMPFARLVDINRDGRVDRVLLRH